MTLTAVFMAKIGVNYLLWLRFPIARSQRSMGGLASDAYVRQSGWVCRICIAVFRIIPSKWTGHDPYRVVGLVKSTRGRAEFILVRAC